MEIPLSEAEVGSVVLLKLDVLVLGHKEDGTVEVGVRAAEGADLDPDEQNVERWTLHGWRPVVTAPTETVPVVERIERVLDTFERLPSEDFGKVQPAVTELLRLRNELRASEEGGA